MDAIDFHRSLPLTVDVVRRLELHVEHQARGRALRIEDLYFQIDAIVSALFAANPTLGYCSPKSVNRFIFEFMGARSNGQRNHQYLLF
jgi:hypothetical protein